jgi:hypothetical protein
MDDEVTLTLKLYDLECIADGLEVRLKTWRNTLEAMQGEENLTMDIEECTSEREAEKMVVQYEKLTTIVWQAVNAHRASHAP